MFKVQTTQGVYEFFTHAEASRFVRAAKVIKARLITREVRNDQGRLGGYGRVGSLRPVHAITNRK
jgi:hypothetical protein